MTDLRREEARQDEADYRASIYDEQLKGYLEEKWGSAQTAPWFTPTQTDLCDLFGDATDCPEVYQAFALMRTNPAKAAAQFVDAVETWWTEEFDRDIWPMHYE
jgi:hypothetical protein